MHIRLLVIGDRQPAWVDDAVAIYTHRFPREWKFRLDVIPTVRRQKSDRSDRAINSEGELLSNRIEATEYVVLLDERGRQLSSRSLADKLNDWQSGGHDVCFVIGGPDGVARSVHDRADFAWSLSELTLPHGMARAMVAEQMYRAWTLLSGHPYHRE